jgi:vancomycin resistance protein YoaR
MTSPHTTETPKRPSFSRPAKLGFISALTLLVGGLMLTGVAGIAYFYTQDRILAHVAIGDINVSGLDRLAATEMLQQRFDAMLNTGLQVELFDEIKTIDLHTNVATDPDLVYQLIDWSVTDNVDQAMQIGRQGPRLHQFFSPLYQLVFGRTVINPNFTLSETRLSHAIRDAFPNAESEGTPTDFVFIGNGDQMQITVVEAVPGAVLQIDEAFQTLRRDAQDLQLDTLSLRLIERSALISKDQAKTLVPQAQAAVNGAPYTLTFTPEYGDDITYTVTANDLKVWLLPTVDAKNNPVLNLDTSAMTTFLDKIHTDIDISPRDAKFVIENNRVLEFSESRAGFIVNDDQLLTDLRNAFGTPEATISISAEQTAPTLTTANANDLGIKEVLGVGYSSFAGSPANRRTNIRHGAEKLNGLLIAPGETLSLLEKLKPFTVADGYLPELVIKGDDIIPEIGGGLCQIGTTTFRAAMNSGLDIAERRNHSLVVSYYNDPSNNNPGTDATIYDPAPDLKILNDTGNYIMLITNVDSENSELHFTFWGTSDGRQGSYTPPQVLSWTGTGAPIYTPTTSLPPGKESCQAAHPGATTTFTYNITQPDGTVKAREFFSSYRALPKICLVGVTGSNASESPPAIVQGVSDEPI